MSESNFHAAQAPLVTARRTTFILTLWVERPLAGNPVWRGYVETGARQRLYFDALAELDAIVQNLTDWTDPAV